MTLNHKKASNCLRIDQISQKIIDKSEQSWYTYTRDMETQGGMSYENHSNKIYHSFNFKNYPSALSQFRAHLMRS